MARVSKIIASIFGILLLVAFGVPFYFTCSAEGCASCHSMRPYYESWKASMHVVAARHCLDCHIKPGATNRLLFTLFFWREIEAEFSGRELKPTGVSLPGSASCVRAGCHALNRTLSANRDITINHREHVTRFKIMCVECHSGTVHAGVKGIGKPLPSKELCFRCHGEQKNQCSFCHTKRFTMGEFSPHGN